MPQPIAIHKCRQDLLPLRWENWYETVNPSKPAKYGLLYQSLCDAKALYTYSPLPYAGKPEVIGANNNYVTDCDEYTKWLVNNFQIYGTLQGRKISLDRYFTSVILAEWCFERNITIIGTLKSDRIGIPKEMKGVADREEKSTVFCYSKDEKTMLLSYIDKKKKGKKNILALTTMHNQVKLSIDDRKKPHALIFYDHTKGGVDVVDLISAKMSTRMKTRR